MTERECRNIVRRRSGGNCERCGRPDRLTVHHRRKRSHGGLWSPENCLHLCGSGTTGCHGWVEANPAAARASGFWLFTGDSTETPVLYRHRWQVLDDVGGVTPART